MFVAFAPIVKARLLALTGTSVPEAADGRAAA